MLSTRALARAFRAPAARLSARTLCTKPVVAAPWKQSGLAAFQPRAFSTGLRLLNQSGSVDQELAMKLQSELDLEKEMKETGDSGYPPSVQEYLKDTPFKLVDKPGQQDVELVRKFGSETIKVVFSISDLSNMNEMEHMNDEGDLMNDEPMLDEPTPNKSSKSAAQHDDGLDDEDAFGDDEPSFPARVNITIEKPNQGALQIEALVQDGMVVVENVLYHADAALATAQTADADWQRRESYGGPPFPNLDEDLQQLLERYIDERGINTSLALFIPEYIDFKEQKEYLTWLANVKGFVEA
ncbi:mitochondrial glycoprotein [Geopyxis carbonaria]|nr:mitochondrial glycoprotein [Geopyxis carbonaria]